MVVECRPSWPDVSLLSYWSVHRWCPNKCARKRIAAEQAGSDIPYVHDLFIASSAACGFCATPEPSAR
jgi:hypothetical protein